ncbi:MAG: hypothetical protein JKY65_29850 [Planctomycetes bacterium]|nr:hypothetical protein [Planctomycetota bacterium]
MNSSRFSLTTYFLGTGVVIAVLVAVVLATWTANEVGEEILQARQSSAERIALNLNRNVFERFLEPTIEASGSVDLTDPKQLAALDRVVALSIAAHEVRAVYIFDLEGHITYSTNHEHIGAVVGVNPSYQRATAGQTTSLLVARGNPLDVSGHAVTVSLLETYVPVRRLDAAGQPTGPPVAVIEIYQDATTLESERREAMLEVAGTTTFAIGVLMLALWLWIRRAEITIEERSQALMAANARLEALSHNLEGQVEDRTRRLIQAETLASVGTLAAGVAHEVNNPVAAIAASAEGLLRQAGRSDTLSDHPDFADFPEFLGIIRDEAFRVKSITRNLLDFSRGEGGGTGPVDVVQLITSAARLCEHQAKRAGKSLELELPEREVVAGNSPRLRQVVLNLTVNALAAAKTQLRWSVTSTRSEVLLTCLDDGTGFDEEALKRGFEPFFTQGEVGEGTGLGLWIAFNVVADHGGRIELENGATGGGCVKIWLPREGA